MRNMHYRGIPSIAGKTADQAVKILYDHCHQSAQMLDALNKEVEDLKDQIESLMQRLQ